MTPCQVADTCLNSPHRLGPKAKCAICKFCPDNIIWETVNGLEVSRRIGANFWEPATKGVKHPLLEAEKLLAKKQRADAKLTAKRSRNKTKIAICRRAKVAEQHTESSIIKATKNSGRAHKDGDHVMGEDITLDTKSQSRSNPVVLLSELSKVREDAKRAGKSIGALVLRNCNNVGVVVMAEEDFALLAKGR